MFNFPSKNHVTQRLLQLQSLTRENHKAVYLQVRTLVTCDISYHFFSIIIEPKAVNKSSPIESVIKP